MNNIKKRFQIITITYKKVKYKLNEIICNKIYIIIKI